MAGIFQRLFKTGQAEAHAMVDKLEDPIKMSEQAIRDLKKDLQESLKALAEVKAISIRLSRESEDHRRRAEDYERKAMLLLQKAESGQMEEARSRPLGPRITDPRRGIPGSARRILSTGSSPTGDGRQATEQCQRSKVEDRLVRKRFGYPQGAAPKPPTPPAKSTSTWPTSTPRAPRPCSNG